MTVLPITTEYIKLQDLMKLADLVSTGGEAKLRILNEEVTVNSEVLHHARQKAPPGRRGFLRGPGAHRRICDLTPSRWSISATTRTRA